MVDQESIICAMITLSYDYVSGNLISIHTSFDKIVLQMCVGVQSFCYAQSLDVSV